MVGETSDGDVIDEIEVNRESIGLAVLGVSSNAPTGSVCGLAEAAFAGAGCATGSGPAGWRSS